MRHDRRRGTDRRTSRLAIRVPDRRTGFDRRAPAGVLTWFRDRPSAVAVVLIAIVALNAGDYFLTIEALDRGAREANPIMAALFARNAAIAGIFKLGTALAVVSVIWHFRRYRRILGVSLIAVGGFGALIVYQLALVAALR